MSVPRFTPEQLRPRMEHATLVLNTMKADPTQPSPTDQFNVFRIVYRLPAVYGEQRVTAALQYRR